jgi:uncharacterized protein (TIGR00369 family)
VNALVDFAQLSGIEQLRAVFDGGWKGEGIGRTMGFSPITVEEGLVIFEGHPDHSVYNPIGTVHGGYAATLLDSAMGCAVHSRLKAGQGYTTLELKVAYHKAMTDQSGPVRAEGRAISVGRRAAFAEGKLFDKDGKLCATATTTCLVYSS